MRNTQHQTPNSKETPSVKVQDLPVRSASFGGWSLKLSWCLVFGVWGLGFPWSLELGAF